MITRSQHRLTPCLSYWIGFFLFANLAFWQPGNPNPGSRLAALAAFVEQGNFHIDAYVTGPVAWTNDWAKAPDGHYYSNKAPGPMILGLPFFVLVDRALIQGLPTRAERDARRRQQLPLYNWVLCALLQVIPFAVLSMRHLRRLQHAISPDALGFAALALLFGNTVSLLMNTYFGHAMTAVWTLAALYALERRAFGWLGFAAGWAALSDYTGLPLFVVLVSGALAMKGNRRERIWPLAKGLLLPAVIWSVYHIQCFGRPWRLALQFQSPQFVDAASYPVWGILEWAPNLHHFLTLLFGPSRGILFTQPWLLIILGVRLKRYFQSRESLLEPLEWLSVMGFVALLLLNSAFNGWHGGETIGPRYLSAIFPCLALLAGQCMDQFHPLFRRLLWWGLSASLLFYILVFSSTLYVPVGQRLWPFLINVWIDRITVSSRAWIRPATLFTAFLIGFVYSGYSCRRLSSPQKKKL